MPTADRKTRTRLRSRPDSTIATDDDLRAALAASHGDEDAWREVRGSVARYLLQRMKDADHALRAAEAYHKRPEFLPMRPPASVRD